MQSMEQQLMMRENTLNEREVSLRKVERVLKERMMILERKEMEIKSREKRMNFMMDILDKIRNKREVNKEKYRICVICGERSNRYCAQCKASYYCSSECQRVDWKDHKNECVLMRRMPVSEFEPDKNIETI